MLEINQKEVFHESKNTLDRIVTSAIAVVHNKLYKCHGGQHD